LQSFNSWSEINSLETKETPVQPEIPPKRRDLSVRYGRQSRAGNPDHKPHFEDVIPPINQKHPLFLLITSFGFALLYAELLFFAATYYGNSLAAGLNIAAIAGVFVLSFGFVYASFTLPHRYYRARFHDYSPIIFLVAQWTLSVIMLLVMTGLDFTAGIFLVDGKLDAVGELLRSLALYSLAVIILFHGLVVYVRYVRFLYEREMHESYKIVSFAGITAAVVLILTLYLLQFDLGRMGGTQPNQAWLALHLTIRVVILVAMTIYVFVWHATVLADH
jgi:hypothetical protein